MRRSAYLHGELHEQVNRLGTALRERLGVRPEERVLLLMLDSPEMISSFFGAIKIGAVPVPINTLWTSADYEFVLHDARPRVVIVTDSLRPRIVDAVRRCPWVRHLVVFGEAGDGEVGLDELVGSGSRELEPEPTSADAPAFWLYSSGSTGSPKGCVHLQHDMLVCANNYARGVLGIASHDRCFSVAKLFFAYGLGNAMYFPLAVGATSYSLAWCGHAARRLRPDRTLPADVVLLRADPFRDDARAPSRGPRLRLVEHSLGGLGRRGAATDCARSVSRAIRRRDPRRHRFD